MKDVNVDTIKETIKYLPEDEQEIILHLTEIFEGEEENINEYVKDELIGE
ncbi:hypothetical protein CBE01nite_24520 [Clostridium beijerinckii]|uniref:Uncharacterized protein n=2 Tax=Clostridium beijerinckii TaxID=1520 RepID=A0AAE5H648_CLOBE|nr:hypothetical protein [Clostridium beijerinckii]NRZ27140.1 hypothetical protein [Clostridium beijerinckii]NSB14753.1 hypothetical protein [Clostridium beijerinckii]NYB97064.1 hypothetical protein [Clostridium beijerinckii]OOM23240.1 hypothetical protein CLOBE_41580 [Clostridium beijerinckii]QUN33009.1 hypothetical protein KEC93_13450 [Clostridium beijerinckii]